MGASLDGSVVVMLMAWWSGGETMVEWWFDGGLIKIKMSVKIKIQSLNLLREGDLWRTR